MIGREDEVREYRDRAMWLVGFVLVAFSLILSRLVYLQIIKGAELARFSEANRLKKERLLPMRGVVYDREGKVIADSRAAFDVVLFPQFYPFDKATNERLAKVVELKMDELNKRLDKAKQGPRYYPNVIRADVSKDVIAAIEMDAQGFPGVDVEATVQRRYPHGELGAQLMGYISEINNKDLAKDKKGVLEKGDYIGRMGLEKTYDSYLRGVNGVGYVEVDSRGRRRKTEGTEKLFGFVSRTEPRPGKSIHLTIDLDLQKAAHQAMQERGFYGAVVVLDPRSGEVLASLSEPSYQPEILSGRELDPEVWAKWAENIDRPMRNKVIQDTYSPGSTFKTFMAVAGLAENIVNVNSKVNCTGGWFFGNRRFSCWKKHGLVDFHRAVKESCDVYFYQMSAQMGIDTIAKYARMFGFGARTEIEMGANEQRGLIPDTEWKKQRFNDIWHPGETLSVAIGQGYVTTTPLQLGLAYSSLANEGFVYRPYVLKRVEGLQGETLEEAHRELIRKIDLKPEYFKATKAGLKDVVNTPGGTAYMSRSKLIEYAGKTGTVQVKNFADIMSVKCERIERKFRHHGWFVGFAPIDNPEIVVATIAEHACHGSSAAPIARAVIDTYFKKQRGIPLEESGEDKAPKPVRVIASPHVEEE